MRPGGGGLPMPGHPPWAGVWPEAPSAPTCPFLAKHQTLRGRSRGDARSPLPPGSKGGKRRE
eukprot:10139257-Prorocentrum_lima.AAC.1